jgi:hypothetical protein
MLFQTVFQPIRHADFSAGDDAQAVRMGVIGGPWQTPKMSTFVFLDICR